MEERKAIIHTIEVKGSFKVGFGIAFGICVAILLVMIAVTMKFVMLGGLSILSGDLM